jgi:hypothetical protein
MNSQDLFDTVATFYAVAHLGSGGLELNLRETTQSLHGDRALGLTPGYVGYFLSRFIASRADRTSVEPAIRTSLSI